MKLGIRVMNFGRTGGGAAGGGTIVCPLPEIG